MLIFKHFYLYSNYIIDIVIYRIIFIFYFIHNNKNKTKNFNYDLMI